MFSEAVLYHFVGNSLKLNHYSLKISLSDNRPFYGRCQRYVTALATCKKKKAKTGGSQFNPAQIRLHKDLKYHLVVMLGARIDVVEASI